MFILYFCVLLRFSAYESSSLRNFSDTIFLVTLFIIRIKFGQICFSVFRAPYYRIYKYMQKWKDLKGLKYFRCQEEKSGSMSGEGVVIKIKVILSWLEGDESGGLSGWMDGRTDGRTGGQMGGWMDEIGR